MVSEDSSFKASVRFRKNTSRMTATTPAPTASKRRLSTHQDGLLIRITAPTAVMLVKIAPLPLVSHKATPLTRAQTPSNQTLADDRGSRIDVRERRIDSAGPFSDSRSSSLDPRTSFHRRRAAKVKPT